MSTAKNAAEVIAALLAQAGLDLPVRLRAWDGSEAGPLEPLDGSRVPVLVARSPRALQRILWRPGELGLARAYVSGDLDVEGDLTDGLRRVRPPGAGPDAAVPGSRWPRSRRWPASGFWPCPPNLPAASSGSAAAGTAGPGTRR
jgi:cyclopropane-fatty-acyl-phospholipid synthase